MWLCTFTLRLPRAGAKSTHSLTHSHSSAGPGQGPIRWSQGSIYRMAQRAATRAADEGNGVSSFTTPRTVLPPNTTQQNLLPSLRPIYRPCPARRARSRRDQCLSSASRRRKKQQQSQMKQAEADAIGLLSSPAEQSMSSNVPYKGIGSVYGNSEPSTEYGVRKVAGASTSDLTGWCQSRRDEKEALCLFPSHLSSANKVHLQS